MTASVASGVEPATSGLASPSGDVVIEAARGALLIAVSAGDPAALARVVVSGDEEARCSGARKSRPAIVNVAMPTTPNDAVREVAATSSALGAGIGRGFGVLGRVSSIASGLILPASSGTSETGRRGQSSLQGGVESICTRGADRISVTLRDAGTMNTPARAPRAHGDALVRVASSSP
jgi:hypothetical protein